jgi:putative peptidoglycan lipid II flippase
VIRASVGTWMNYATTVAFQVLFAGAFGASNEASGYVIAFALAVSASGIFITTALWVVLPRMVTDEGAISQRAIRAIAALALGACALSVGLAVIGIAAPSLLSDLLETTPEIAQPLFVTAAVLLSLLALAGLFNSLALARGRRFLPALGPAMPSITGAIWLIVATAPSVTTTLLAVTVGALIQTLLAAFAAIAGGFRVADTRYLRSTSLAIWMMVFLASLSIVAPLQRIVATSIAAEGAAQFDYASRGLMVVLQLVIGGLIISTLPEWSSIRRRARILRQEITRATALTALLLATAGALLFVAVIPVVTLFLQRGAFTADDTAAVSLLVRLMIPGLVAEGLFLVVSQALLAAKFTRAFLLAGFGRVAITVILTISLGLPFGSVGVAVAYAAGLLLSVTLAAVPAVQAGMFRGGGSLLRRTAVVSVSILTLGALLSLAGDEWAWLSAAAIVAAALGAIAVGRLIEVMPPAIRHRIRMSREPA